MRTLTAAVLLLLSLASALPAGAASPTRYLTVVNRSHDSVTALSIAPTGSSALPLQLSKALRGGGGSTTVEIAAQACRQDVRVLYRDGRTQMYRDVDVCRQRALRLQPLPRDGADDGSRFAQADTRD